MGWGKRLLAAFVGLAAFGMGLSLVTLACLVYLGLSFRQKNRSPGDSETRLQSSQRVLVRIILALALSLLALAAFASGGILSPAVFGTLAAFAWFLPWMKSINVTNQLVPVEGSILLRSRFIPLRWYALAEVKPGSGDFPRALSSFSGELVVWAGKVAAVYAVFRTFALDQPGAERSVVSMMRDATRRLSSKGVYLLPVDSRFLPEFIFARQKSERRNQRIPFNLDEISGDLIAVRASSGHVAHLAIYTGAGDHSGKATLPAVGKAVTSDLLLWELVESIGKRSPFPGPDGKASLLSSLYATRGEPLGEKLSSFRGAGESLSVTPLGGEEVELSRPQLRAIVSMYS